jgi:polyhydroxyalkanoate synthesis regulator phasin/ribosomal protein L32
MVGVGEIAGLMSSLKAAKDIAQTMVGLRDAATFQAKAIEFQSKIFDAMERAIASQEERAALVEKVSELEKEVAQLEAWETEKQRYELKDVGSGSLAFTLKPECAGSEPPHHICAQCYQHAQKSILQPETRFPGRSQWLVCHGCGADIVISGGRDTASTPRQTHAHMGRRLR